MAANISQPPPCVFCFVEWALQNDLRSKSSCLLISVSPLKNRKPQIGLHMKYLALPITLFNVCLPREKLHSQNVVVCDLQHRMTLKIPYPAHGDGGAVIWNPRNKVYYCSFFGSPNSPLLMFDSAGNISATKTEIGLDCRAIWYNSGDACIEGAASEVEEYFSLGVDATGAPKTVKYIYTGHYHMFEMGMGSWVAPKNEVWYYSNRFVHRFRVKKNSEPELFELDIDDHYFDINAFAMVYTGIRNAEVGLYDYVKNRILLFSRRSGKLKRILNIQHPNSPRPSNAGFSFSNGLFWLYDNAEHAWYGYR